MREVGGSAFVPAWVLEDTDATLTTGEAVRWPVAALEPDWASAILESATVSWVYEMSKDDATASLVGVISEIRSVKFRFAPAQGSGLEPAPGGTKMQSINSTTSGPQAVDGFIVTLTEAAA